VTSCKVCPHVSFASRHCFHGKVNQSNDRNLIFNPEEIPAWCPLQNLQTAELAEQPANGKFPSQPGHLQQIKDSIPLLKSAMESLSRRCDSDERDGALYNIDAVIAVLESVN